jgi:CO/xanthine dehydrogenase FAD-binding subunit
MMAPGWIRPDSVTAAAAAAAAGATIVGGAAALCSLAFAPTIGESAVDLEGLGLDDLELPRIGAMVTLERLTSSDEVAAGWPVVAEAAAATATPEVRRAATVGGTIAARLPTGDLLTALCAVGAAVVVVDAEGRSTPYALPDYLAEAPAGIVTEVELGLPCRGAYRRFANRAGFAPAVCAVAGVRREERIELWAGAVGERPIPFVRSVLPEEAALRNDVHASAWYRRRLLGVLSDEVVAAIQEEEVR